MLCLITVSSTLSFPQTQPQRHDDQCISNLTYIFLQPKIAHCGPRVNQWAAACDIKCVWRQRTGNGVLAPESVMWSSIAIFSEIPVSKRPKTCPKTVQKRSPPPGMRHRKTREVLGLICRRVASRYADKIALRTWRVLLCRIPWG